MTAENLWAGDDAVQELSIHEYRVINGRDPVFVSKGRKKLSISNWEGMEVLSAPIVCIQLGGIEYSGLQFMSDL